MRPAVLARGIGDIAFPERAVNMALGGAYIVPSRRAAPSARGSPRALQPGTKRCGTVRGPLLTIYIEKMDNFKR